MDHFHTHNESSDSDEDQPPNTSRYTTRTNPYSDLLFGFHEEEIDDLSRRMQEQMHRQIGRMMMEEIDDSGEIEDYYTRRLLLNRIIHGRGGPVRSRDGGSGGDEDDDNDNDSGGAGGGEDEDDEDDEDEQEQQAALFFDDDDDGGDGSGSGPMQQQHHHHHHRHFYRHTHMDDDEDDEEEEDPDAAGEMDEDDRDSEDEDEDEDEDEEEDGESDGRDHADSDAMTSPATTATSRDSSYATSSDETKLTDDASPEASLSLSESSIGSGFLISPRHPSSALTPSARASSRSSPVAAASALVADWTPRLSKETLQPTFFASHTRSVRGVAFSPSSNGLFCSAGYDGLVNLYDARKQSVLRSAMIAHMRHLNCVSFSGDGDSIVVGCVNRKLLVVDVESSAIQSSHPESVYNGSDRAALATLSAPDAGYPSVAACTSVNGRGLSLVDIRMAKPAKSISNIHRGVIRDVTFITGSWARKFGASVCMLTASQDGNAAVVDLDGNVLHLFEAGCPLYSAAVTPEPLGTNWTGIQSSIVLGGDKLVVLSPEGHVRQYFHENNYAPVWKLRYSSTGSYLYAACDDGVVRRYVRTRKGHLYEREIIAHVSSDIEDMALSTNDEFLVTASRDETVGLVRFRTPSFGCSEFGNLI